MRVYLETNFLCELAYSQGQARACKHLLAMGQLGLVQLVVPAYSLIEASTAVAFRQRQEQRLQPELTRLFREHRRSQIAGDLFSTVERVFLPLLATAAETHLAHLTSARDSLLAKASVIPLTAEVVQSAAALEADLALSAQDATVLASVLADLFVSDRAESCFLNRNSRDFADSSIVQQLEELGCRLFTSFDSGHDYISSKLGL